MKKKQAAELIMANLDLKKAEEYKKNIKGLEEMMFMTSHKVRQPVANILGLSDLLDQTINSPDEHIQLLNHIKQSDLVLDYFTKELMLFISHLEQKGKIKNMPN
ncbi:hypothetical protein ACM55G_07850 [Flavobacterium sp. LB3P122]|uniref:hypothetical protein n=1 Tax=Flavobacterium algoriphilum TaxID=3398738 RepID=UPI003A8A1E31